MLRTIAFLITFFLAFGALAASSKKAQPAPAQVPAPAAPQLDRSVSVYQYYTDADANKVLLQTQFSLANFDADTRVLRRLHEVVAGLNERGFRKNPETSISDWDKKEAFAKCYLYLDELQPGKKGETGARIWCAGSGLSEFTVSPSENLKHVDQVLQRFDLFFSKAKQGLKK